MGGLDRVSIASIALACLAQGGAASAADGGLQPTTARHQQVMLYVSRPLGLGVRGAIPVYGLRFERVSAAPSAPGQVFAVPERHRAMVDLQLPMQAHAWPSIHFDGRYRWNLQAGRIEPLPR